GFLEVSIKKEPTSLDERVFGHRFIARSGSKFGSGLRAKPGQERIDGFLAPTWIISRGGFSPDPEKVVLKDCQVASRLDSGGQQCGRLWDRQLQNLHGLRFDGARNRKHFRFFCL